MTAVGADDAEVDRRLAAIGHTREQLGTSGLVGTPAEVLDQLAAWRDAGAERAYLQILDLADLDHLELIAAEVARRSSASQLARSERRTYCMIPPLR